MPVEVLFIAVINKTTRKWNASHSFERHLQYWLLTSRIPPGHSWKTWKFVSGEMFKKWRCFSRRKSNPQNREGENTSGNKIQTGAKQIVVSWVLCFVSNKVARSEVHSGTTSPFFNMMFPYLAVSLQWRPQICHSRAQSVWSASQNLWVAVLRNRRMSRHKNNENLYTSLQRKYETDFEMWLGLNQTHRALHTKSIKPCSFRWTPKIDTFRATVLTTAMDVRVPTLCEQRRRPSWLARRKRSAPRTQSWPGEENKSECVPINFKIWVTL